MQVISPSVILESLIATIELFDSRSEYEKKKDAETIKSIDNLIKRYPSARVVGRGTLVIDPSEIINSEEFKQTSQRARELVERYSKR